MTEDLEKYIPIKKKFYEYLENGSDIKYRSTSNPDTIMAGGIVIANYINKEGQPYFMVRYRTSSDRWFILRYDAIDKLYKRKTIYDIMITELSARIKS